MEASRGVEEEAEENSEAVQQELADERVRSAWRFHHPPHPQKNLFNLVLIFACNVRSMLSKWVSLDIPLLQILDLPNNY